MSRSTQLDPAEIHRQASNHDQTRENIVGQLDQLKVDVQNVLQASGSAATRALSTSTDSWVESVKKTVISHMEAMAQNIRREADGQEATDETLNQQILNIPIETGNFLGGR
jgi:formylmethanofuran:tetrahydromethanopterin formyltransferase